MINIIIIPFFMKIQLFNNNSGASYFFKLICIFAETINKES